MLLFVVSELMDSSAQRRLGNLLIEKCWASQYHVALCILYWFTKFFFYPVIKLNCPALFISVNLFAEEENKTVSQF